MQLKVLLVDDEADSRSVLKTLLTEFCPQVTVCGEASNIDTAYELILHHKPQAVFLDIQMPGGNGFALLKKFTEIPFDVVFLTSYDHYAIEAIRFSALDYLLKPIEVEQLKIAVAALERSVQKKQSYSRQVVNVIRHLESNGLEKKVVVHHNDMVVFVPIDEISYLCGERNYTVIRTVKDEKYTSSKNLGEYEEMFSNYTQFYRIGKNCIANLNHVSSYSKGDPCLLFIGNESFEISRRKKQGVIERLRK